MVQNPVNLAHECDTVTTSSRPAPCNHVSGSRWPPFISLKLPHCAPQENLIRFAEALRSNSHVQTFSLANTRADDPVALAIAKMLAENSSIVSLNIESNYVSGKGVMALVQALPHNHTLTQLRFHNQRHMCGGQVGVGAEGDVG